ncbi:1,4-alpha-glucan branching enzyme [Bacillus luteolus]|uniref:1,4-alpha-glucan branching enzyme GlgB n=1 Tax=Litchfieldia luteola TaxID=682179 RepID=A0ABR9QIT8_9BACI|nr:1,4-alpha-glucan branching enzyme [Cytobacillus luteolus]MBE4908418.1 1,4-alpha-glucan branching enzyme [Cytobacillus luteolus]MBP1943206.1 1,4-alpha-glucan branching enzyme [Cytobacillus luteolus]
MILTLPTSHDIHLFHEGNLFKSYQLFGAHLTLQNGVEGTQFTVWAPHAAKVNIVGNFNQWEGEHHPLDKINNEGIWTNFFPGLVEGDIYKYEITTDRGDILLKSDPFAFYSEIRPATASVIYNLEGYKWNDRAWQRNKRSTHDKPLNIYEVHLGSWKVKTDGTYYSYEELSELLIPYVLEHGFTHIELLPLVEHPLDKSWGYQGTGYYSATSRYGTPHGLMYLIDQCHQNGIGVIMDWVPGHFCKDSHGLYLFDGKPTYEYSFSHDRENKVWGTANFDLSKPEVQSFLISNALFWIDYFHIDGFRVDAVANMIYWPTSHEGEQRSNPFAIEFLKKLNSAIREFDQSVLMIAEDSTVWPKVTSSVSEGGLGFSYKWNMGWMNDILTYMQASPYERKNLHNKVTFSLLYAFSEKFILPFSHDEVVHGKRSMLDKMPGDYWDKFAQLRLLYGYLITHPGKKLLFMGGEFGQFSEWKDDSELDWNLDDFRMHQHIRAYVKELFKVYKKQRSLYELDNSDEGFEWIDVNNYDQSIFSFIRKGKKENDLTVTVCNFTPETYHEYKVGVPLLSSYKEVLNSDDIAFGGSGQINKGNLIGEEGPYHGKPYHIKMTIPPFGISIVRPIKRRGEKNNDDQKKVRRNAIGRGKGE